MKRIITTVVLALVLVVGAGITVYAAGNIDTGNSSKGYVTVSCNNPSGGKLKVMIEANGGKYTYDLSNTGKSENFPLQLGNGSYKISLLENTSGSSYKLVTAENVNVNISNANAVYLNSIQNVNWGVSSKAVAKAKEVTASASDPKAKAQLLWDYMIKNNKYDYKKLAGLPNNYVPFPDSTLTAKTGICYDFSSLYAAMLRSQGTPAKLVKGYAPKNAQGYHAWNEVYDSSAGKWIIVDTTYDLQVVAKNAKVGLEKNSADFQKVYEY